MFRPLAAFLLFTLLACAEETIPPDLPPPNRHPVLSRGVTAQTLWQGATRVDVDLTGSFSDPDGDVLAYAVASSDTSIVSVALHPGPVVSLAGPVRGTATVTVTARDPDGLEAQAMFPVAVVENPDRAVLAALAHSFRVVWSFNGSVTNQQPDNWLPEVPLGDWYGVDVNAAGRVICLGRCWSDEVDGLLESLGFVGSVPAELGRFENLEFLALIVVPPDRGGMGVGPIPGEWGALANLEFLWLEGWMTGPVPPEFGSLAALRRLHLLGWHLSGPLPASLRYLSNLEPPLDIGTYSGASGGDTDICVDSDPLAEWLVGTMGWSPRPCRGSAHLIQVVQSRDGSVPLVADRPAALRTIDIAPPARARFYLDGTEVHVADLDEIAFDARSGQATALDTIAPAAIIPRSVVQPGLEMVVEWDQGRFPPEGRKAIDVVRLPPLELTLVPLVFSNPDTSVNRELVWHAEGMASSLNKWGFRLLPAHGCRLPPCSPGSFGVEAKTHPLIGVVETTGRRVHSAGNFLSAVSVARRLANGTGYWMGVVSGSGVGGMAVVGGHVSWATGLTAAQHELGHNLSLRHPPNIAIARSGWHCDAVTTFDRNYPYDHGWIGAWGYNLGYPRFVPPNTPDVMTYCGDLSVPRGPWPGYRVWISDYHYKKALSHRRPLAAQSAPSKPVRSLLLWGGYDAVEGAYLEPAFVVDAAPALPEKSGPWRLEGRDAAGRVLFTLPFTMPEIADAGEGTGLFTYTLPVRPGWEALASVTLSGPGGAAVLDGSTDRPVSIYRDGDGRVRAILQGDPVQAVGASGFLADVALDVVTSRGIPSAASWRW